MAIGRPPSCLCDECFKCKRRIYMRAWYQRKTLEERRAHIARRDPETTRKNDAARYRRDTQKRHALSVAWAKRHPEKKAAQDAARRAIVSGKLIRQPCEVCGKEKVHAHHDDYSQPLAVRWLCPLHHSEFHKTASF